MATFRKYGGTNFSPIANIVRHNILNSKSSSFNTSGLYNSKETFLSHVDMSGNSLLHVGNLYFQDGTSMSTRTITSTLAAVLEKGNSAGNNINMNKYAIEKLNFINFKDDTTQNSSYTGWCHPSDDSHTFYTYNSPKITFDTNGKITDVSDNDPVGLENVLEVSNDGGGKDMTTIGNITQDANKIITQSGSGYITQSGTGRNELLSTTFDGDITINDLSLNGQIKYSNGNTQTSSYTGFTDLSGTYYNATLKFDNNGQITSVTDNSAATVGLEQVLTTSGDGGGKDMTNIGNITQTDGTTSLNATTFYGNVDISCSSTLSFVNNFYDTPTNFFWGGEPGKTFFISNDAPSNIFGVSSFIFLCKTPSEEQVAPVSFDSGLFTVDVSQNHGSTAVVKYQASNTNNIAKIGHNFTGTTWFNADININTLDASSSYIKCQTELVLESSRICLSTSSGKEIKYWGDEHNFYKAAGAGNCAVNIKGKLDIDASAGGKDYPAITVKNSVSDGQIKHYTNLGNDDYNYIIETGDNAILTFNKPLVLAYSSGSVAPGLRITNNSVRLQSNNATYYSVEDTRHNFTGNTYITDNLSLMGSTSYLQFPDESKQYIAAYSSLMTTEDSTSHDRDGNIVFTLHDNLTKLYNYCFSGVIYLNFNGNAGDNGGSITYSISFTHNSSKVYEMSDSIINFKLAYANIPYSFITTGVEHINVNIQAQDVNGKWSIVGSNYSRYIRI
jgi:hypothetical protein